MKRFTRILALCLLLTMCLSGGVQAFAATNDSNSLKPGGSTTASTPAPSSTSAADSALKEVRRLIDAKKYYEAALACDEGRSKYSSARSQFNDLWSEIASACRSNRPRTGELERTFQYQGGNELRMTAQSGNVVMTATDVDNPRQYVRFFIRKGEDITVYLPAGEYELNFVVGDIWFDNRTGFGDFGEEYSYRDHLEFNYTAAGGWVTYYYFEDVL